MSYGIIFWGNSSYISVIFKMQKRIIGTIMVCRYRESCRELLKELEILPLISQYFFFFGAVSSSGPVSPHS
jgi:hypothetical protein